MSSFWEALSYRKWTSSLQSFLPFIMQTNIQRKLLLLFSWLVYCLPLVFFFLGGQGEAAVAYVHLAALLKSKHITSQTLSKPYHHYFVLSKGRLLWGRGPFISIFSSTLWGRGPFIYIFSPTPVSLSKPPLARVHTRNSVELPCFSLLLQTFVLIIKWRLERG